MGFFDRMYYGKAGKKDYTESDMPKTRMSLFFMVLKDHLFDLIKVNLLQIISWLPFIIWSYINIAAVYNLDVQTILAEENGALNLLGAISGYLMVWLTGLIPCLAITGPSSAGAAYIMRNWARDQHTFLFSDFKDAFKSNWKQALGASAIISLLPIVLYTCVTYYGNLASGNKFMILPLILVLSASFVFILMIPLLYPLIVGYELKFRYVFKNALLLSVACLPQMLLARIVTAIPAALLLYAVYAGNSIMLLIMSMYYLAFGFAFSRLVYASVANAVFDKYLNPRIEGAVIGQGLRPEELDDEDDEDEEDEEE